MSFLLIFHLSITAIATLILWVVSGPESALSLLAGAGLSFLNLVALTLTWGRVLAKKQVALAFSVIVFKFAFLGWILYEASRVKGLQVGWFSLGMALVIVSVLATSWKTTRNTREK